MNKQNFYKLILVILFSGFTAELFSQNLDGGNPGAKAEGESLEKTDPQTDQESFRSHKKRIVFEIARNDLKDNGKQVFVEKVTVVQEGMGIVNELFLQRKINVKANQQFGSLGDLRVVLDNGFNQLLKTGYFVSENGLSYQLIVLAEEEESRKLELRISCVTRWTVYLIPWLRYTSADGLSVGGRLRWDNFLGTLNNISLGLNVRQNKENKRKERYFDGYGSINLAPIHITPNFSIGGSLSQSFDYNADEDESFWQTGLGVYSPVQIPIPIPVSKTILNLSYSPSASITLNYLGQGKNRTNNYVQASFSHSFSINQIKSSSNGVFIEGYSAHVTNNFVFDSNPSDEIRSHYFAIEAIQFGFSLKLARNLFDFLNTKGRFGLGYTLEFADGYHTPSDHTAFDAADYSRGIRPDKAEGSFVFYLNMDFPFWVFDDKYIGDVLLSPFIDFVWLNGKSGFSFENPEISTGLELIYMFSSLRIRFGVGLDLNHILNDVDLKGQSRYMISIQTDFYY